MSALAVKTVFVSQLWRSRELIFIGLLPQLETHRETDTIPGIFGHRDRRPTLKRDILLGCDLVARSAKRGAHWNSSSSNKP